MAVTSVISTLQRSLNAVLSRHRANQFNAEFHDDGGPLSKVWDRYRDIVAANWHLGVTSFGGPPVHFQIVRRNS